MVREEESCVLLTDAGIGGVRRAIDTHASKGEVVSVARGFVTRVDRVPFMISFLYEARKYRRRVLQ